MNYFVLITGTAYLCASLYSMYRGNYSWSIVWLCYGTSALVLANMEGKS